MENTSISIPKIIHYFWIGKEMPDNLKENIKKVRELYKDYEIKIWGEKDFDFNASKYTREALKAQKYAFVSDYYRVKILYEYGGIYLDTDLEPYRDMRKVLENRTLVLGFEYSKMVTTGFAACVPKHPFMKKILEVYDGFEYSSDVKFIINNEIWSYFITKIYGLKMNNKTQELFGNTIVYPMSYFSMFFPKKNSIFLHKHNLSWTSPIKAWIMNFALSYLIRPLQKFLSVFLIVQKWMYFSKNKKIMKSNNKFKSQHIELIETLIQQNEFKKAVMPKNKKNSSKINEQK